MGCVQSKDNEVKDDIKTASKDAGSKSANKKRSRASRISVAIKVGAGIRKSKVHASSKKIVFFFGGPKSGKGQVIEELVESFGVKVISAESLIVNALPKKLANLKKDGEKLETATMMSMLRSQPNLISLEWILELVKNEVMRYPEAVHVIDLLPNSKHILRNKTLFEEAPVLLEKFEETCPVAFAMHLYIDKENLNKQLDQAAHLTNPEGCTAPDGVNDEADSAATKRRHAYFEEALKPVQKYFKESDRLIEVDVSSMSHERIWFKVVRMFASFDLSERQTHNNLIVIFVSGSSNVQGLADRNIRTIKIVDIVDEPDAEFDLLMECLLYQISELGCPNICYVVDITGSTVEKAAELDNKKRLVYQLLEPAKLSTFLNKYQLSMMEEQNTKWDETSYTGYKAPNNLTLLFSPEIARKAAEVISTTYCSMDN